MSCDRVPPPGGDELLAYLDGEADAALQEHLAECPDCRGRLLALKADERGLRAAGRPDCPPRADLAAYAEAELPAARAEAVHAHLEGCQACRADLAELAGFTVQALAIASELGRARLGPRRPAAEARAGALAPPGPLGALRRVVAAFRPLPPLAAGQRARGGDPPVVGYSAAAGEVIVTFSLRPDADEGTCALGGRVHGLRPERLVLRGADGRDLAASEVDDQGAFSVADVPPGEAWLRFTGPGLVLELDGPVAVPDAAGPITP